MFRAQASIYEPQHAHFRLAGHCDGIAVTECLGAEAPRTSPVSNASAFRIPKPLDDPLFPELAAKSTDSGSCDVSRGTRCNL